MSTCSVSSLDVPLPNFIHREHLGTLVVGIIKQIFFHRDQMPMPFDILDCHVKSGRSATFNAKLLALHVQLRDLFQSMGDVFQSGNVRVDQVGILFGQNRFTAKELHKINLPVALRERKALADLPRLDDLNAVLRLVLEEDPFSKFPSGVPNSLHVYLHASPVDLGDPFLDDFEPMMRFVPEVAASCPQSVFNLKFVKRSSSLASTVRRSGSHWSVCHTKERKSAQVTEVEGIRKRLFDDSQLDDSAPPSDSDTTSEESDADVSDLSASADGDEEEVHNDSSDDELTSSEDENDEPSTETSMETSVDPSRFIWYRSKTVIAGWMPHSPSS